MSRDLKTGIIRGSLLATLLFLFPAGPGSALRAAGTIALVGGRVLTMAGRVIEEGTVVFNGDGIIQVLEGSEAPPDARAIDAGDKVVMPGMIDSFTHLGLVEIGAVAATRDMVEGAEPVTPEMSVLDAVNPYSELIPVARSTGVTTVLTAPGEANVISGRSAVLDLSGMNVEDMLVKSPAGVHVNLGEASKHRFSDEKKGPETRMGIASLLRKTLVDTDNYVRKWAAYREGDRAPSDGASEEHFTPSRDLRMEAMIPVLEGTVPLIVRAHRVDDVETALRIADEFGIKLILCHATEAYKLADELARRDIPVLLGPVNTQPSSVETEGAIYENAAILSAAGVKFAIQTSDAHNVRLLPYSAGLAVAYGLPREEALKAITIYPAEILGVSDRLGSLETGKEANIAVFDGDPLEPRTRLEALFIRGEEIDLRNRQTDLYEKYLRD